MARLYFTRTGADRIMRQKQELRDKLKSTQGQKGEAAQVGGNQWHDNFSFEQLTRDEQMINAQLAEINEKTSDMVVMDEVSSDITKLRIGHIAILDVEGEQKTYRVGGFEDSDSAVDPPVISYLAPLIRQFIGKEQGYVVRVQIAGRIKQVTLEEISLQK